MVTPEQLAFGGEYSCWWPSPKMRGRTFALSWPVLDWQWPPELKPWEKGES